MMAAMTSSAATDETLAALSAQVAALSARCEEVLSENAQLRAQRAWFQRQLFGRKSERRIVQPNGAQGTLGEAFDAVPDAPAPAKKTRVAGHERSTKPTRADADESTLFFDEGKVPVEVVAVANPEAAGLAPEDDEVIGERISHRLAQRPGSYVVLKYVRPVIKRRDTQALSCPAVPVGVIEGSRADVSFIAGLLVDKLVYHLPLYRQPQRLAQCGIRVSRQWLTQIAQAAIALIEPVHDAQWQSILLSRVKRMDETPLKAGRDGPGKMKSAYFWPVMGEHEEICFHYLASPSARGGSSMRCRRRSGSLRGWTSSSRRKACCRAVRSRRHWPTCASAATACCCIWTIRMSRSIQTHWSARCTPFQWARRTGCSAGPSWVPSRSASRKACW